MPLTNFPNGLNAGDSGSTAGTLAIGGTAITATAAELNYNVGQTLKFRAGTVVTVAPFSVGTAVTGLSTVNVITASIEAAGTGLSKVAVGTANVIGGTVVFALYGTASAAATTSGTIHWIAAGT